MEQVGWKTGVSQQVYLCRPYENERDLICVLARFPLIAMYLEQENALEGCIHQQLIRLWGPVCFGIHLCSSNNVYYVLHLFDKARHTLGSDPSNLMPHQ